jgi:hypothetical protein
MVSYRYVPRNTPAAEAPTEASAAQEAWLRQLGLAEAEAADRRQRDLLACQDVRRQREEQWRRE